MKCRQSRLERVLGLCFWLMACESRDPQLVCTPDAAVALYERRIAPVLQDGQPKTCNQCHLSGIDLSLFVRDTPCQTMACLKQLGLVDFAKPEQSTVLSWIGRAKPDSELITPTVIAKEHDGFLEWIRYSASCGQNVCPSFDDPCGKNQLDASTKCEVELASVDYTDPGDCTELTLERLFSADVYRWRERCFPCHFTSDKLVAAPKWITDLDPEKKLSAGVACAATSLDTMRTVLARGYVDLANPAQSLILRKPLSTEGGGVPHGGGPKFEGPDDPSYQTFLAWITRYAKCAAGDATLSKAAPPPPPSAADPDAGGVYSIYGYCNCVLRNCHNESHARWGESDQAALAGCRTEALHLPSSGTPTAVGNFLECRAQYCEQAAVTPDACRAALGQSVCL